MYKGMEICLKFHYIVLCHLKIWPTSLTVVPAFLRASTASAWQTPSTDVSLTRRMTSLIQSELAAAAPPGINLVTYILLSPATWGLSVPPAILKPNPDPPDRLNTIVSYRQPASSSVPFTLSPSPSVPLTCSQLSVGEWKISIFLN